MLRSEWVSEKLRYRDTSHLKIRRIDIRNIENVTHVSFNIVSLEALIYI